MYAVAKAASRVRALSPLIRGSTLTRAQSTLSPVQPAKKSGKLFYSTLFIGTSVTSAAVYLALTHRDFRDYLQAHYGIVPAIDAAYSSSQAIYAKADSSLRKLLNGDVAKAAERLRDEALRSLPLTGEPSALVKDTPKPAPKPAPKAAPVLSAAPSNPTVAKVHAALAALVATSKEDITEELTTAQRALDELDRILRSHIQLEKDLRARAAALSTAEREQLRERDALVTEVSSTLTALHAAELTRLQKEFDASLDNKLASQRESLNRAYRRDVSHRVETERGGRLARLQETLQSLHLLKAHVVAASLASADAISLNRLTRALHALCDVARRDGIPFADELAIVKRAIPPTSGHGPDVLTSVVASIDPLIAHTGLPTEESLSLRFADIATEVRRSALVPADGGFFAHLVSRLLSPLLLFSPSSSKTSSSPATVSSAPEVILARAEAYIHEDLDLEMAARELNQLDGWHAHIVKDWIDQVRQWAEVRQALDILETEAFLRSLQHD